MDTNDIDAAITEEQMEKQEWSAIIPFLISQVIMTVLRCANLVARNAFISWQIPYRYSSMRFSGGDSKNDETSCNKDGKKTMKANMMRKALRVYLLCRMLFRAS